MDRTPNYRHAYNSHRHSRGPRSRPYRYPTQPIASRSTGSHGYSHSRQRPRTSNIRRKMTHLRQHNIKRIRRGSTNQNHNQSILNRNRTAVSRTLLSLHSRITRIRRSLIILRLRHIISILSTRHNIRTLISRNIHLSPNHLRLLQLRSALRHLLNRQFSTKIRQANRNLRHNDLPKNRKTILQGNNSHFANRSKGISVYRSLHNSPIHRHLLRYKVKHRQHRNLRMTANINSLTAHPRQGRQRENRRTHRSSRRNKPRYPRPLAP